MDTDRTLYLVFANAAEGKDDEFNEWYDNEHVPDVLSAPGIVSAQRFDLYQPGARPEGAPPPKHRYLAVYEIEGEVEAASAYIREAVASGKMSVSDTADLTTMAMSYWSPRGPRIES